MQKKRASIYVAVLLTAVILAILSSSTSQAATTIFFDDFDAGYAGWNSSGLVASDNSPAIGANSVRLRRDGQIWRTVSTVGYSNISLSWTMAAHSLENSDSCTVEINSGGGWEVVATLINGDDDSQFRSGTVTISSDAEENSSFQIRYRVFGNSRNDFCYAEEITVDGTSGVQPTDTPVPTTTLTAVSTSISSPTTTTEPTSTLSPTPSPTIESTSTPSPTPIANTVTPTVTAVPTVAATPTSSPTAAGVIIPGDPLTGSGNVSRSALTYNEMINGAATGSPLDESSFALPANAAHPIHQFNGRLQLQGEATSGSFTLIRDDFNYAADLERQHIPEFDVEFVQNGSHLIPTQRGLVTTGHPYWNVIIGPGRVWQENDDNGYSRASFPFALVEKNANCTHNGAMMFLFNGSDVSKVWYQITQETCLYVKADFWGQLDGVYQSEPVANSSQYQANFVAEVANQFPTKPIAELAVDYPGFDLATLSSGLTAAHLTTYGVVVDGINYVARCEARYGTYSYCNWMRLPSYSTAKSSFAGVAMMRLGQKYNATVSNLLIKDYVPEYSSSAGNWGNVTLDNTLDMATGNYRIPTYMRDEDGAQMADFFAAETYADRISEAFSWRNRSAAGTTWVYHTSDTFIATQAMMGYLQSQEGSGADLFDMLATEVYAEIGMGPGAWTTLRTSGNDGGLKRPLGGYGLWFIQDDIAKLVTLLNNEAGNYNGTQLLHPDLLADAMQKDPSDRGLPTSNQPFVYNNGFWGHEFTMSDGYPCDFYTPFMSGFGGITIVMMPNGSSFYYFNDNDEFDWYDVVQESHDVIGSHCP